MALSMATAVGTATRASAEESGTSAQQSATRSRIYARVQHTSSRKGAGAKVQIYRKSPRGRVAVPHARACIQRKVGNAYRTIKCARANRWGKVSFRKHARHVKRHARRHGAALAGGMDQSATAQRWGNWYRVYVPGTYGAFAYTSGPFSLWNWGWDDWDDWGWNGWGGWWGWDDWDWDWDW